MGHRQLIGVNVRCDETVIPFVSHYLVNKAKTLCIRHLQISRSDVVIKDSSSSVSARVVSRDEGFIIETHASLAPFHKWLHLWMGYRQLIGVNTCCDETVIALSRQQKLPSPPDKPLRCGDKRQFTSRVGKSCFTRFYRLYTIEILASLAPFHKWLHHWMGYRLLIGVNMHGDETVSALSRQQSKGPLHPSPADKPLRCGDKKILASLAPFHKWLHHWMGYRLLIGVNMHGDKTVSALSRQETKDPLHPSPPDKPLRSGDKRQFIFCVRKSCFTR
ncbi:hypothetical protein CDAR_89641 [Caerostris darwini]|uniref:Maturase K n=1 Tax=Caerostris darwini TaxID=1538125 RepID=A0AAV4RQG3_9ARAC|nr:hypothetical protein CDAR_89641 [Caerostris darwini]